MNWSEKIEELKIRMGEALEMGGPDKILRQREQEKLTARMARTPIQSRKLHRIWDAHHEPQ